jgi:LPXTG-motif cell wall-anchored protein
MGMKKWILAALIGAMVTVFFAAPAFAIRDPFAPVIDLTPAEPATSGGGTTSEGPTVQPQDNSNVGSEQLANTGADTEPWLVLAYGLLVAGGAALALAKVRAPARTS